MNRTIPADEQEQDAAYPHLIVAPFYRDEKTGALYVHQDLDARLDAWETESHIAPVSVDETFGDYESWVDYVRRYGQPAAAFLTWNSKGLRAVLDYHQADAPARATWRASYPFVLTPEATLWFATATGIGIPHPQIVEFLDDRPADIYEPEPSALLNLLRNLRGNVSAKARSELRADGTTTVAFERDTRVAGVDDSISLPPEITIAIPVLRGHVDGSGLLIRYKLVLKLRASVDSEARLQLRLTMPQKEAVLADVYNEILRSVRERLGDGLTVYRAAD